MRYHNSGGPYFPKTIERGSISTTSYGRPATALGQPIVLQKRFDGYFDHEGEILTSSASKRERHTERFPEVHPEGPYTHMPCESMHKMSKST